MFGNCTFCLIYPVNINLTDGTFDYDNMFTNINFGKTKSISREFYHLIEKETTIPVEVFIDAISFTVEGCPYFTYDNEIYRQIKGLGLGWEILYHRS